MYCELKLTASISSSLSKLSFVDSFKVGLQALHGPLVSSSVLEYAAFHLGSPSKPYAQWSLDPAVKYGFMAEF